MSEEPRRTMLEGLNRTSVSRMLLFFVGISLRMETFLEWGPQSPPGRSPWPSRPQIPAIRRQHAVPRQCGARFYTRSMTDLNTPPTGAHTPAVRKPGLQWAPLDPRPSTDDQEPPATGLATKLSKPKCVCFFSFGASGTNPPPSGGAGSEQPSLLFQAALPGVIQFTPCPSVGQSLPGSRAPPGSHAPLGSGLVQSQRFPGQTWWKPPACAAG